VTTKRLRLTGSLATAAALLAAAVPATASAGEQPLNYGHCLSEEAMSGGSVREFTASFGPATVVGDRVNLPPGSNRLYVACGVPEGSP
jgi:hypothetical protein